AKLRCGTRSDVLPALLPRNRRPQSSIPPASTDPERETRGNHVGPQAFPLPPAYALNQAVPSPTKRSVSPAPSSASRSDKNTPAISHHAAHEIAAEPPTIPQSRRSTAACRSTRAKDQPARSATSSESSDERLAPRHARPRRSARNPAR